MMKCEKIEECVNKIIKQIYIYIIWYIGDIMYNLNDAYYVASILDIKFDKFTPEEFLTGINIEMEHGNINPKTNVTNDDLLMTSKIALAHLNEFPNYYNLEYGLKTFEDFLQEKLKNYQSNWLVFIIIFEIFINLTAH